MSNRSLVSFAVLLSVTASPVAANPRAFGPAQTPAPAAAAPLPTPVCALEGEIGEGRGQIVSRGAGRGYLGELTRPVAGVPAVVLSISSEFTPNRPAVDRITLSIGAADAADAEPRLSGEFGSLAGRRFSHVRGAASASATDDRWFEALMAGRTLTAADASGATPVSWSAEALAEDYNYLLDLLQLVAGWEVAGLCINRAPAA